MSHLATLQSTWTTSPTSGVSGQTQTDQDFALLNFTFDDDIPASAIGGTSTHPNATYKNAVTAATFTVDNRVFKLDSNADNTISIVVLDDDGTDASIALPLRDADNAAYLLDMKFEDANRQFDNYALSNLIGLLANANSAFLQPIDDTANAGKYALQQRSPLAMVERSHATTH